MTDKLTARQRGELLAPQQEARDKFSSHVQSIAFQLTLSRRMIDCLRVVRDYGFPHGESTGDQKQLAEYQANREVVIRHHSGKRNFTTDNFVGFMRSLENRGLVTWNQREWNKRKPGERTVLLSRAGELTCLLLVEAGLMPPRFKRGGSR